jgi:hypothetical protein
MPPKEAYIKTKQKTKRRKNIMKKLLTAILVIAMIASIATVAAFADYEPLTITAGEVTVEEGATEAIVPVTITGVPEDLGISSITITVKAAGTTITAIEGKLGGNNVPGDPGESVSFMWADISKGAKTATVDFADVKVAIPADAKAGDEIVVEIITSDDPDNYLSFEEVDGDTVGFGAVGVNGKITITEKGDDSTDTEPVTEPVSETGTAKVTESDTAKADDGKKAPQTGDVAIIVVAAMIVALGTAIVVKKVNVK